MSSASVSRRSRGRPPIDDRDLLQKALEKFRAGIAETPRSAMMQAIVESRLSGEAEHHVRRLQRKWKNVTVPDPLISHLSPCPFCGGGQFRIHENGRTWRDTSGWSEPISIEIQHWCDPIPGQPAPRMMAFVGRDQEAAVKAWNRRTGR